MHFIIHLTQQVIYIVSFTSRCCHSQGCRSWRDHGRHQAGTGDKYPPPTFEGGWASYRLSPPPHFLGIRSMKIKNFFSGGLNKMEFKNNKDIKYAVFRSLYVVKMSARASRPHYLQQNEGKGALNAMFSSQ